MKEQIYRRLAEHLDRLPGRFAPSETGAELRLLERLFTPQEAELATYLTLDREGAQAIAARVGLAADEAERQLDEMAHKGLICIGCGLCVSTCPSGALALARKPESERTRVPATSDATWRAITQAQAQAR